MISIWDGHVHFPEPKDINAAAWSRREDMKHLPMSKLRANVELIPITNCYRREVNWSQHKETALRSLCSDCNNSRLSKGRVTRLVQFRVFMVAWVSLAFSGCSKSSSTHVIGSPPYTHIRLHLCTNCATTDLLTHQKQLLVGEAGIESEMWTLASKISVWGILRRSSQLSIGWSGSTKSETGNCFLPQK